MTLPGFSKIIGQEITITKLMEFARLYHERGETPDHIIIIGGDGMGKRTIAEAFAEEFGRQITVASALNLEKKGDLTAILTSLDQGGIFFLEEIDQFSQPLVELLIVALREDRIDLILGQGAGSRIHPYQLPRFTFIASVKQESDCNPDLREAFAIKLRLQPYSNSDLQMIVQRIAMMNAMSIDEEAAALITSASNGNPREAETLVRKIARSGNLGIDAVYVRHFLAVLGRTSPQVPAFDRAPSLDLLSGIEFEKLIGDMLTRMNFQVEMTKASGDGGIDIVATLDRPVVGGRYLFQCKRFAVGTPVGASVVREFYGSVRADHRAVKGILITTSSFTSQARDFATGLPIELIG